MSTDQADTPLEQVLFLARAESRVRTVEHLVEAGPATQRELRTNLEASRTTVSRSLQSLADRGWVEKSDGEYRLTCVGRAIATEFTGMLDAVGTVEELSDFLRWFPDDVETPDLLEVSDLEVTYSTEAAPYAPARKQTEILHTAERIRLLLPATDLDSTEAVTEQVTERGLEVETVVSPDVASTFESDEFSSLLRRKLTTERSTLFVAPGSLPLYLGLADDGRVQIGVDDDQGIPRALLETGDQRVREWAEGVYRDHRERATHKPVEEF